MGLNTKNLPQSILESLVPNSTYHPVVWCITGGGHQFQENLDAYLELTKKSIPIILVFSKAGALVVNRYGFFYRVKDKRHVADSSFFIFENKEVLDHNIYRLLDKGNIAYTYLRDDPSFSYAFSLVNSKISCIIVSPMTSNSVAKVSIGISDTFITNIVVAAIKAGKDIAIVPTDVSTGTIKTKLPIKYKPGNGISIDISICKYGALEKSGSGIMYLSEYCVGCMSCVKKYPDNFTYGEELIIVKRPVDGKNIDKLSNECTILSSPVSIPKFVLGHLSRKQITP